MRVGAGLAPGAVGEEEVEGRVAVVIDVIRASTTVVTALTAGATRVVPVASTREARRVAAELRRTEPGPDRVLLCGERGGRPVQGFDLGNSPAEYAAVRVADRSLVFTTTNGTRMLERVRAAAVVLVAGFVNLAAVVDQLTRRDRPVLLACAGRGGRVGLEDVWCAGLLAERLAERRALEMDDGARVARAAARELGAPAARALRATAAGAALASIGYEADLEACAALDSSPIVPVLSSEGLVTAEVVA